MVSYNKLRLAQLAEICKSRGLPAGGTNKAGLIQRLQEDDSRRASRRDPRAPTLVDVPWGVRGLYPVYIPPHLQYIQTYIDTLSIEEMENICRKAYVSPLQKSLYYGQTPQRLRKECFLRVRAAKRRRDESFRSEDEEEREDAEEIYTMEIEGLKHCLDSEMKKLVEWRENAVKCDLWTIVFRHLRRRRADERHLSTYEWMYAPGYVAPLEKGTPEEEKLLAEEKKAASEVVLAEFLREHCSELEEGDLRVPTGTVSSPPAPAAAPSPSPSQPKSTLVPYPLPPRPPPLQYARGSTPHPLSAAADEHPDEPAPKRFKSDNLPAPPPLAPSAHTTFLPPSPRRMSDSMASITDGHVYIHLPKSSIQRIAPGAIKKYADSHHAQAIKENKRGTFVLFGEDEDAARRCFHGLKDLRSLGMAKGMMLWGAEGQMLERLDY